MRGNRSPVPRVEKLSRAVHVVILERDLQNTLFLLIGDSGWWWVFRRKREDGRKQELL